VLFTVVIPAHNAAPYIDAQLSALESQIGGDPFEVILVDNMSTDRTAEVAMQHAGNLDLRIVTADGGRSAAYARNVGIQHARGEVIVFVDADDVADSGLLAAYRRMNGKYAIMGGHYEENRLNDPRVAAWRFQLTKKGLPIAFHTLPYFLMGNVAIHRSVFDEIGTLDEVLTHGGEEVDFSTRAHLAGYEVGWAPDAVVYYRHRTTLRGLARQFFDYGRATTYVYARHRKQAHLPRTTLMDTLKALWDVFPHAVNFFRGNKLRGQWVLIASFYAGEVVQSIRQRVWYLGP
jgi:glycosyltransferase involved in cell wall biosynthesis